MTPCMRGYGAGYDLAARRKNATRESTATLKAWLNEHKKNPYPTKGEKIMLAIITKMTLTQVSTWFANARRRLKKENKMTWEPKNKTDDDDDAVLSDSEDNKDKDEMISDNHQVERIVDDARRNLDDNVTGRSTPVSSHEFSPVYCEEIFGKVQSEFVSTVFNADFVSNFNTGICVDADE
ncbi:hypothetical protein PV326_007926 [Microctonus aethiopoides]|nr:hypothetical protein PV326_007926 [Microctonus aethiopoides]